MDTPLNYMDLTHDSSNGVFPDESMIKNKAWTAADVAPLEWVMPLTEIAITEIHIMIKKMHAAPLPMMLRTPDEFEIPALRAIYIELKNKLDEGKGFAVIDRFPIDEYPIEDIISVYWTLGQILGPNVAQKWDGTMVYDVTDTKKKYGYGVRGSATNVELVFHTDNAFGVRVPDYVGLLCQHAARHGGLSRFCSLYAVHQRMNKLYPKELERLYKPMLFDRQAEHYVSAPKTSLASFFSWRNRRLYCRANTSLVKKGYDIAGEPMDSLLKDALAAMDEVTTELDLWVEAPLERGQVQYLNNHEVGHYRSDFIDNDDISKKRHLYRLWHRHEGSATYDG